MKLSQAIREGAKLKPQGFGGIINQRNQNTSCAMLAAGDVLGFLGEHSAHLESFILAQTGITILMYRKCLNMNDSKHLSRERIADWVEAQGF